jgi:hypothetical protein
MEEAEEDFEKREEFYFVTHITCLRHNTGIDDDDGDVFYSIIVTNTELFKFLMIILLHKLSFALCVHYICHYTASHLLRQYTLPH